MRARTDRRDGPRMAAGVAVAPVRPRVLQVITHLDMGGAENVAMQLIEHLRDDCDFALFAVLRQPALGAVGQGMADRLDGWNVGYRFGVGGRFKSGGVILAARALARAVAEWRIDVVHLHTEVPELTYAVATLLTPGLRRTPLLRTVHNSSLWIDWATLGRMVTGRLAHGQAVAVSHHAARADAAIPTRVSRPIAPVIHNGVSPPPRRADRLDPGPVRILFAGRFVMQKGADLLPDILAAAYRATPRRDVCVTIAGSGALQPAIERGLAGRLDGWDVRIVPPIERLSTVLARFDAVLLPSRFEGFALLPLETLMAGVPLVTTDAPGLDEMIPPAYPLAAPVEDVAMLGTVLARVIDDPATARAACAAYGAELADRFGVDAMAAAYLARYRTLARAAAA